MKRMHRTLVLVVALCAAYVRAAEQCAEDAQGNTVCVGTQDDKKVCKYTLGPSWHGTPPMVPFYCTDVVVTKTAAGGQVVYKRVLGGASDDYPVKVFFDTQGSVVLLGITWSEDFPVTPDALQAAYAGPALPDRGNANGGDLFLTVLGPSGNIVYSTFAGSSGNDNISAVRAVPHGQIQVLVSAGDADFPVIPKGSGTRSPGPLLMTIDLNRHIPVRSMYLPVMGGKDFSASMQDDGSVILATAAALYRFSADGQLRTSVSLESYTLSWAPRFSIDPAGDVWLVGTSSGPRYSVARFAGGSTEVFRWTVPFAKTTSAVSFLEPLFGSRGLTYVSGHFWDKLTSTTPNAVLTAPCSTNRVGFIAALDAQGEVKLLSYLPQWPTSLVEDSDGGVSAVLYDGSRISIDLSERPKAVCLQDTIEFTYSRPPFGAGQVVRLLGGGFGPESPVTVEPGTSKKYPVSLDGLQVKVGGIAAPILSAARGEVVFQIPYGVPDGEAIPVAVVERGETSADLAVSVRVAAPAFLTPVLNSDGSSNSRQPARPGSVITLHVTGAGRYSPALEDGSVAPLDTSHKLELPVAVWFSTIGLEIESAVVLYAGPAPGLIGVAQLNIQLPARLAYVTNSMWIAIGSRVYNGPSIWVK